MQSTASAPSFPWSGKMREIANVVAQRLGVKLHARGIWLFGSCARDEVSSDSDIDLLVVVAQSVEPRYRRAQRAHQLVSDLRVPKDIVVLTQEEWDAQLKVPVSLANTVRREGILLYGIE